MFKWKKRKKKTERVGGTFRLQAEPMIFIVIATVTFLMFVYFEMDTALTEKKQIQHCHFVSLAAAKSLDESINDVDYYEFLFKTCVRKAGYAL